MARDKVTVGRSPSGIKATTIPNVKMKEAAMGSLTNDNAATKKKTPKDIAIT